MERDSGGMRKEPCGAGAEIRRKGRAGRQRIESPVVRRALFQEAPLKEVVWGRERDLFTG